MENEFRNTFIHLIFFSVLFVLNFMIWLKLDNNYPKVYAQNNNLILKEIESFNLENIYPIDDEDAIRMYSPSKYVIENKDNYDKNYDFIILVDNDSTIDINNFKYMIKNNDKMKIGSFKDLKQTSDNKYKNIYLYNDIISSSESKNVEFLIWLDSSVTNEAQNKTLSTLVSIAEYQRY